MTVLAPDAEKAATLDNQELVYASFPIEKWEDGPDGSVYVYGKATTPEVDTDDQVVDSSWSGKALKDWMASGPNLRVMHNSQRDPAGSGVKVEVNRDGDGAHWVKSIVDEPVAVRLVKGGHLRAYSVGIAKPVIERDMTGKARGGIIRGGSLAELSLVDRPANVSCSLSLVKAAKDGHAEFPGTLDASGDFLAKADAPTVTKSARNGTKGTVTVELPKNMSLSVKPSDLAKLATLRQKLARQQAAKVSAPAVTKAHIAGEPGPELVTLNGGGTALKRDMDPNVGGGVDRDKIPAGDFAGRNRSFPIVNAGDVPDAFESIGRAGADNYSPAKLRRNIARIARRKGFPLPASQEKPKASATKAASAKPQVTKCMKCDDSGMMDGKPCPECKAGKKMARKAAEPEATKKKGKLKILCPGCGARQNKQHIHCPECGMQIPSHAMGVEKNHDFTCLGCGKSLDKGERFCPQCGRENPGHNPAADQKIPANQDKAAGAARKDRVAKKARKKGKGKNKEPFGGQQAMPFGKEKDKDEADGKGGDAEKSALVGDGITVTAGGGKAKKTAKPKSSTKGMKPGKGKKPKAGHKPTPGEAGGVPGQHDKPAPPHREPDGGEVEAFERDAHIEDGDSEKPTPMEARTMKGDPEAAAAMTLKALDVPQHIGALHALTCPAYSPEAVAKAFPHASFAGIDTAEWHAGALEKAASAPLSEAQGALGIYQAAVTLKGSDPYALADLRTQAHKAFRDANPGPASFPEPGQISPTRFNRPYISDGHGAASPGHMGPNHARVPAEGGIVSTDYNRPYLDAGHASESPTNQHTPGPMQPPTSTGVPTHEPAQGFLSSNAIASMQHAMSAMHDHISRRFPDVCPMEASMHIGSNPVPVPHGVPQPAKAPGARKARKAAKVKAKKAARKQAKVVAARRRKIGRKVLKGALSVDDARLAMGLKPIAPPESPTSAGAAAPVAAALDPEAFKAAIAEATAAATKPLQSALKSARKAQAAQGKALRRQARTLDAIASQPDTSASPMRMAALTKSTASAAPAVPQTVSGSAEQAQITKMQLLQNEWRNSPDPSQREAAYAELTQMLGVNSMTPPNPMTIPMRT